MPSNRNTPNQSQFAAALDSMRRSQHPARVQNLASRIDAVTVYREGARITRLATLDPSGSTKRQVVIAGLPLALEDGTVRARIAGERKAGLPSASSVKISMSIERSSEPGLPAQDEMLEAAVLEVLEQTSLIEQVERELEQLGQFELRARAADTTDRTSRLPESPLDARLALLSARTERWRSLHEELEGARNSLEAMQRKVRVLKDQNERATTAKEPRPGELRKAAVVTILGECRQACEVVLEYRVGGARWAPAYVARIESDGTSANIGARAIIAQRSGEDWNDAKLTLVTARPDVTTAKTKLQSLRVGRRQAESTQRWCPPPIGTDRLFDDYRRAFGQRASGTSTPAVPKTVDVTSMMIGGIAPLVPVTRAPPPPPGAMPPPAPAPTPEPEMDAALSSSHEDASSFRMAKASSTRKRGKKLSAPDKESAPAQIRANESLLDFEALELAGPDGPQPGSLVPIPSVVRFRAALSAEWSLSFDLAAIIESARRDTESLGAAVPSGYSFPAPEDFDYSYFADSRVDVPSDGSFHSVALTSASGPSTLRYLACPRESTDVFRVVRMTNPLDAPVLPGPVDIYLGDEFLLTTQASFTAPGAPLRFGLGVEQAIEVVRNTSFRDDSAGILRGSRELHHQIRVEAQNNLDREIEIEIRERVPVTKKDDDEVRVEIAAVSPMWSLFEPGDDEPQHPRLRGGYRWVEKLAPAAKVELRGSYTIRISNKHELVGGNRREQ